MCVMNSLSLLEEITVPPLLPSQFFACFKTHAQFKVLYFVIFDLFCYQDPQYMQQALTNVLLMDTVVRCLQTQKAIYAASKLAYFEKLRQEGAFPSIMCLILYL